MNLACEQRILMASFTKFQSNMAFITILIEDPYCTSMLKCDVMHTLTGIWHHHWTIRTYRKTMGSRLCCCQGTCKVTVNDKDQRLVLLHAKRCPNLIWFNNMNILKQVLGCPSWYKVTDLSASRICYLYHVYHRESIVQHQIHTTMCYIL